MARLVKTTVSSEIFCDIVTTFKDNTTDTRQIKAGDVLDNPGIRYVYNKETKEVKGRVTSIGTVMTSKLSKIDLDNPKDNFINDVQLGTIGMDCSTLYKSQLVQVPSKEVVESEGVEDVASVHCYPHPKVTLIMTYTDGSTSNQELEIGDALKYVKIMTDPGKPVIEGSFKVIAFGYTKNGNRPKFDSVILKSTTSSRKAIRAYFDKILSFEEVASVELNDSTSMAAITSALKTSENGKASATLNVDITIPERSDGKITTTMISAGQELDIDLNGHSISTQAYAFYVNGGTLNIYDSTGSGKIESVIANKALPAIMVAANGVCNMEGGLIDTTSVDTETEGNKNWLYGVACSGNGVFNMNGGKMVIGGAAGISITNGTASGEGAKFTIGGSSVITSLANASVYLADNKSVVIKDKAVLNSGIVARMGDITIQDSAVVNGVSDPESPMNLGAQACVSGVGTCKAAILALTGVYGSSLGNDMNITVKDNAKVKGYIDDAIDIAEVNTRYDQIVNVDIEKSKNITGEIYKIYSNAELAELASEAGKTLGAETNTTTLTVTIDGEVVYPVESEEDLDVQDDDNDVNDEV